MAAEGTGPPDWEHFPHQGDVGVRGFGASPAAAFENVARALSAVVTPLEGIVAREPVEIACHAPDLEILLVDWVNGVAYEMATRRMLFRDFRVEMDGEDLRGTVLGEPGASRGSIP